MNVTATSRVGLPVPDEQSRGLLTAVVVLRAALLVWATIVVVIDITGVAQIRSELALALLVVLAVWTALYGWWLSQTPAVLMSIGVGVTDVALAAVVAGLDMVVYQGRHPQTFASAWPLCAAVVAGILHGKRVGALAGLLIGGSGAIGLALFATDGLDGRLLGAVGTIVLITVAGALAGMVTDLLRSAKLAVARAEAREEVARRLHDGVLQTLAAVQRRSEDPDLVGLAREQELDLRRFIELRGPEGSNDLTTELRATLADAERRNPLRCEFVLIDTPVAVSEALVVGLCGAVNEAITNAAKHGGADRVVVCVDMSDNALICTINDDGSGFDPATMSEGVGVSRSIRGRIGELGGHVTFESTPGAGCEVLIRVPI